MSLLSLFGLPATSVNASDVIEIVAVPLKPTSGVNVAVRFWESPDKLVSVPPVTEKSSIPKPLTSSLSVIETVAVSLGKILASEIPRVASGAIVSFVTGITSRAFPPELVGVNHASMVCVPSRKRSAEKPTSL